MTENNEYKNQFLFDELSCHAFELQALVDLLLRKETERWVPGFAKLNVEKEHVYRYQWISKFVTNLRVLDIACGSGKGSFILAHEGKASEVIGCNLDANAVKYTSIRNKHPNVKFMQQDAQNYQNNDKFNAIVSFETIEHLPNVDKFLSSISELLLPDGIFCVSTPISKMSIDSKPENPHHIQEWGFKEFQTLISKYFTIEDIYIQMEEKNYPSILFWLKKKILNIFKWHGKQVFKEKYLNENKTMRPIKYNHPNNIPFKN